MLLTSHVCCRAHGRSRDARDSASARSGAGQMAGQTKRTRSIRVRRAWSRHTEMFHGLSTLEKGDPAISDAAETTCPHPAPSEPAAACPKNPRMRPRPQPDQASSEASPPRPLHRRGPFAGAPPHHPAATSAKPPPSSTVRRKAPPAPPSPHESLAQAPRPSPPSVRPFQTCRAAGPR